MGIATLSLTTDMDFAEQCAPVSLAFLAADGSAASSATAVEVSLSGTNAAQFYSDSECQTAVSSATVAAQQTGATLYAVASHAGTSVLTAEAPSLGLDGSVSVTLEVYAHFYSQASNLTPHISGGYGVVVAALSDGALEHANLESDGSDLSDCGDGIQGSLVASADGRQVHALSTLQFRAGLQYSL